MATLIQVLRVLDQLQIMDAFVVTSQISPLAMAKEQREKRRRARSQNKNLSENNDW